ncbi:AFL099Wp [Eremothecium gossypii ATCC 10895]|uniref:S-adenosyl-L-methionine-dependent tRNA 4-demethylwyosine synthase n=1 Tax=Eremothecium gossypii (strain ATCC 10895 / CBS 109.51 / FGSC 9923 / NRRL Y-1056) TaxID=284811 RepID=Q755C2_EREGS|nr:AFL099Wp [Eremothecium gossypii ATCC 10895]AAS53275.1 AFL099Wp [Eremothecium gossypii ATCC 10895]AEY97585.1 FAFL099Wp [Eremothecium gossypii FDAG1]
MCGANLDAEEPFLSGIPGSAILAAVLASYIGTGGRISIGCVVTALYLLANIEAKKNASFAAALGVPVSGKGKGCCGGKNGGCCSTKAAAKPTGHKCSCSGAKVTKSKAPVAASAAARSQEEAFPIAIDFTNSFKAPQSKVPPVKKTPKVISGTAKKKQKDAFIKSGLTVSNEKLLASQIYIFYSSLQGAAKRSAELVLAELRELKPLELEPILLNLDEIDDLDKYFVDVPCENALYVLVLPSYDSDSPLDLFLETLEENFNDFRIDNYPLRKLVGYSILGIGDSEMWPEKFCYQAREADLSIAKLGGRRIYPVGEVCVKFGGDPKVEEWARLFVETLQDDEPMLYEYDESVEDELDESSDAAAEALVDLEDIGNGSGGNGTGALKKMVAKDSPTYKNLTKQGYSIVGSHSGVKICRWTKNDLRGRGSCYKHSLFNIVSSRCMELTPSLACSSKCVFCWRHGTNPVAKNWRWELDEPEFILENALKEHYSKIKQMRGVPGVIAERFAKAFQVAHCALSLVGEPILYPYITRFIELLHQKNISSFLVCNAQHPDQLEALGKVTQLYVSIDAPTKTELKRVDRPLYKDFWERLMRCLELLRTSQAHQRTVFRLTLVKGFNMADVSSYADLVQKGIPCFIEVKGATFCGSSDGNGNPLTMQNIPFYEECVSFVKEFVAELQKRGLAYDIAAEHAHSNTVLIAHTKFKRGDKWYTHIDFEEFFKLLNSGASFTHMDYMAETPEWALFGNGGFAPGNTRFYKKKNRKDEASVREGKLA